MDTGVFFVFLALSTAVAAADLPFELPFIDTVFLRYYNRNDNSTKDISLKNASSIVPMLDKNQTTAFYIHGYLESVEMDNIKLVAKTLIDNTNDNVFSLDYRQLGVIYPISVAYVDEIGVALAKAIDDMAEAGLDGTAVHLIGLSLGGQICGSTGRRTAVKVKRISGLDPAGPLFLTEYLRKGDASFVCIIHSDMGYFGIDRVTGDVDFKPNFGHRIQPGCVADVLTTRLPPGVCSHLRSFFFYVESISNPTAFPSVRCNSDSDFEMGNCDTSNIIPMGYGTPDSASGVHYCQTNTKSPYSLGMAGTVYKSST